MQNRQTECLAKHDIVSLYQLNRSTVEEEFYGILRRRCMVRFLGTGRRRTAPNLWTIGSILMTVTILALFLLFRDKASADEQVIKPARRALEK